MIVKILSSSRLLVAAVFLALASTAHAQVLIPWGSVVSLSNDSDILTNGTYFDAINSAQNGAFTTTTVGTTTFNSLSFVSSSGPSITGSDGTISLTSDGGNFLGNEGFTGGSAAYQYVINNASDANNGSVTIGSLAHPLTIGNTYQVQVWGYWSGPYQATVNGDPAVTFPAYGGGYIIGDFTATAITETFTYGGAVDNSGHAGFVNDIEVRDITATPEPATWATMLGGWALLGFSARRKAARNCAWIRFTGKRTNG